MAPPQKPPGYELNPDEVRIVIRTKLEPEIDRLDEITRGLQYHGPAYFPFRKPDHPVPTVTEPITSGALLFGDPQQIVSPLPQFLNHDYSGESYQRAMDVLNRLFDQRFAAFIDNQNTLLETMRDFRQRLLDSIDAYEGTEANSTSNFNRIRSGHDAPEG